MAILTYEEHGVTHRVWQSESGSGKIIRFSRLNTGERWQDPAKHQDFIQCVVWDDALAYTRDQSDWKKWSKSFSRHVKTRSRFFWVEQEVRALRSNLKVYRDYFRGYP